MDVGYDKILATPAVIGSLLISPRKGTSSGRESPMKVAERLVRR
jgi:hypothetical protein